MSDPHHEYSLPSPIKELAESPIHNHQEPQSIFFPPSAPLLNSSGGTGTPNSPPPNTVRCYIPIWFFLDNCFLNKKDWKFQLLSEYIQNDLGNSILKSPLFLNELAARKLRINIVENGGKFEFCNHICRAFFASFLVTKTRRLSIIWIQNYLFETVWAHWPKFVCTNITSWESTHVWWVTTWFAAQQPEKRIGHRIVRFALSPRMDASRSRLPNH